MQHKCFSIYIRNVSFLAGFVTHAAFSPTRKTVRNYGTVLASRWRRLQYKPAVQPSLGRAAHRKLHVVPHTQLQRASTTKWGGVYC